MTDYVGGYESGLRIHDGLEIKLIKMIYFVSYLLQTSLYHFFSDACMKYDGYQFCTCTWYTPGLSVYMGGFKYGISEELNYKQNTVKKRFITVNESFLKTRSYVCLS